MSLNVIIFLYSFYICFVVFFSKVGKNNSKFLVSPGKDQCSTYNIEANSIL